MTSSGSLTVEDGKKARIEIIPLIDVIFFLLATFVLFTLSLNKLTSVPVDLPVVPGKEKVVNENEVTIQVTDGNAVYWNTELIRLSEVASRIATYKAQETAPRILIAGDERAMFGITLQILDEVRRAGIKQVSVETRTRVTGK